MASAPVFISYASQDQKVAGTICSALEARGLPCWIASRNIGPGENFQESIVQALRSAQVMLLVFSSNANNSNEIKKEIVLAGQHHVTVVPVRVEDVAPNDALAYEFATRQWIDLFKDWEKEIERLAEQISAILRSKWSSGPSHAAIATERAAPARGGTASRRHIPIALSAAVVVALLLIGGVALYTTGFIGTPQQSGDEVAWSIAVRVGTAAAFNEYLKAFPTGAHAQEAQLRIADLTALAAHSKNFDGTWLTTISCANRERLLGYTIQFSAQVKDGDYHGLSGTEGTPASLMLDGKIQADGTGSLFAKGLVGSIAAAGVPIGTPYFYHVAAHFDDKSGTGHRLDGRPCNLTFVKQ
jgi:hypothetical protein